LLILATIAYAAKSVLCGTMPQTLFRKGVHSLLQAWTQGLIRYRRWAMMLLLLVLLVSAAWVQFGSRPLQLMQASGATYSAASRVQQILQKHFGLKFENSMVLVMEAGQAAPEELLASLRALPLMQQIQELPGLGEHRNTVYFLQLDIERPIFEIEALVPEVRALLASWSQESGVKTWLTGQQAFFYDMGQASKKDTASAERWGLLLAFVILIFCFGSLSAACLPLLVGAMTLLWTQVLLRWLELGSNQTSLVLNSMLGLGLTIDYCLFMVSRYREERRQHEIPQALLTLLKQTGRTIFYSALVMLAALLILLIPEVDALRGTVQNLILVVLISAFSALVVLPLLLVSLDGILDRPRWLAQRVLSWHNEIRWRRLAYHVTGHPIRYFVLSLSLLLLLALPFKDIRLWEPLQSLAPKSAESVQGFEVLAADGWGSEILPIHIIVTAPEGQSVLAAETLIPLYALVQALEAHPEIDWVQGLVSGREPLATYQGMLSQLQLLGGLLGPELPLVRETPEGQITLLNVYQKNAMDVNQTYRLLSWLKDYAAAHPELNMQMGGIVARAQSFTYEMYRHLPLMLGLILASILLLLAAYLKSVVLPLKAGLINFLPILSAFGVLVWAFQWGHLQAHGGIVNIVPIVLFCIVFGLSMDYEVLILSRIDEAWRESGDVRTAVIEGLSRSSGIITGAALILLGIFSVGIGSSSPVVQEISLGITVTILLDATVVRLFLVPAFMMLMGKWNWWHPFQHKTSRPQVPTPATKI